MQQTIKKLAHRVLVFYISFIIDIIIYIIDIDIYLKSLYNILNLGAYYVRNNWKRTENIFYGFRKI